MPDEQPWRLIRGTGAGLDPVDGATNMAVDAALLESVKAGGTPVVRLYRWAPATLSFGRNQPARGRYDSEAAAARGIDFVRRTTGGQAVLHDDELTYAVVAPVEAIGKPRAAYAAINRALVAGLRELGVAAELAGGSDPDAPGHDWDAACFRRPTRGEVVVGGAKLIGSAQRMEDRTILQHGSILMGGSQAPAEALLRVGVGVGASSGSSSDSNTSTNTSANTSTSTRTSSGWTTLGRELGEKPSIEAVADVVRKGVEAVLGVELVEGEMTLAEREGAEVRLERFASEEWTWRR